MTFTRALKFTIVAIATLVLGLISTTGPALAQESDGGETAVQALEIRYKQAGLAVSMFGLHIDMANLVAGKAQTLIDKASAEGKDTSALVSALSTFKAQIGAAQSGHDTAAAMLALHAGFDGSGKVTDIEAARATLKSVRESLRSGHESLRNGTREFRRALREWRKANKPEAQPAAP
jgi:hypothetical protein